MLTPGTVLQNRYEIVRPIGEGGMGAVYEATDRRLRATVALKETFASGEEERRDFEREAQLLANLRHPSLPKVIDHFSEGDGHYLVMEFIPGDDFEQVLGRRALPFEPEEVLGWAGDLLAALGFLHAQDPPILHRDIKPANIKRTDAGAVYLLDFGLAKGAAGQMTRNAPQRSVYGFTPGYAPPEQVRGAGTDARSDIYAMGATLYRMLTGVAPPDSLTRAVAVATGEPDPLTPADQLNPRLPAPLAAVLQRSMSISREQRHPSAAELRASLLAASNGQPPAPQSQTRRSAERADKNKKRPAGDGQGARKPQQVAGLHGAGSQSPRKGKKESVWDNILLKVMTIIVGGMVVTAGVIFAGLKIGWLPLSSTLPKTFTNGVGMEFVLVDADTFTMGDSSGPAPANEYPAHEVSIEYAFYVGKYEVTQVQWQKVMATNPSAVKGDNLPVTNVSWHDAQAFVRRLTDSNDGYIYRLPSEAEWEFACRAGTTTPYAGTLHSLGWYYDNSGQQVQPVGRKQANAFGLHDMHGNVSEWCMDGYVSGYSEAPKDGSSRIPGDDTSERVLRGGSWKNSPPDLRSARRLSARPSLASDDVGFRVAASPR